MHPLWIAHGRVNLCVDVQLGFFESFSLHCASISTEELIPRVAS